MARPHKKGIEYFPHSVTHGKTMYTIEEEFGNDGYAFFYKTTELLGREDGLFYDCRNKADWRYLISVTHVDEETANTILNLFSLLNVIDHKLWHENKVIWMQDLVDSVADVYKKRSTETPAKPSFRSENYSSAEVSAPESTQSKGKETKEKEIREKNPQDASSFIKPSVEEIAGYCRELNSLVDPEQFYDHYESNGWMVGNNKMYDWKACVRKWNRSDRDEPVRKKESFERPTENYDHLAFGPFADDT